MIPRSMTISTTIPVFSSWKDGWRLGNIFSPQKVLGVCITLVCFFNILLAGVYFQIDTNDSDDGIASPGVLGRTNDQLRKPWQPSSTTSQYLERRNSDSSGALYNITHGEPVTIAYVISLIKCGDLQSTSAGLVDASIVLRHSVHQTSMRNPTSGSKYDYKMYAIVHRDAERCSPVLRDVGYEILIRDTPVSVENISSPFLRNFIHLDGCCGEHEFIKLHAYTMLDHPIVVHVDIDFILRRPMDDLFDAMIYNSTSPEGMLARSRIPMERPGHDVIPERIDSYITRDWSSTLDGNKPGFQGGLMIVRPDINTFYTIINVIHQEKFIPGFFGQSGWGGKGYGLSIYGAMSMQGVMAYIYDEILQNAHVELDYCQFNHLGVGIYETFFSGAKVNNRICSKSNISDLYNIHYGGCRKPWLCPGEISYFDWFNTQNPLVSNHTHCMALHRVWHSVRTDLETQLLSLTGDMTINDGRVGSYMPDVFLGHCKSHGAEHYLSLSGSATTFQLIQSLYDKDDDAEKIMR